MIKPHPIIDLVKRFEVCVNHVNDAMPARFPAAHLDIETCEELTLLRSTARDTLYQAINSLEYTKNQAYSERNQLVCLLSKLFPASLERHSEEDKDWENDWRWIVFISLPTGQCTWHIHDSERPQFDHLDTLGTKWDGHTTEEKYARIEAVLDDTAIEPRRSL